MNRSLGLVAVALALVGCSSRDSQLVGTWRARKVEVVKDAGNDKNPIAGLANGFASMMFDGMTLEFNKSREYKASIFIGSMTGKVSYDGDEIVLTPDTTSNTGNVKQASTMRLKMTANGELHAVKKFESDPDIVFDKVRS